MFEKPGLLVAGSGENQTKIAIPLAKDFNKYLLIFWSERLKANNLHRMIGF